MDIERFSLLLLEPGEIYFEDYSVVWLLPEPHKPTTIERLPGRLKLCSKSLVYEPKDRVKPLIKIQFKECTDIMQSEDLLSPDSNSTIVIKCNQYAEMLEGNAIAPYKFKFEKQNFSFLFNYASIVDCIQQMSQLKRASTLNAIEQNSMIATISHSRFSRLKFDYMWLDHLYDRIILQGTADRITPLVQNPGKIVLTENILFFQPCNNIEPGLEIFSRSSDLPRIYLSFRSKAERDDLHDRLMELPTLKLDKLEQNEMTMQWQNGIISNFEYLQYLNSLADRTVNDLTQYPVFPWVLNDYTSPTIDLTNLELYRDLRKPIGALNLDRLIRLKDRYNEMSPPKFLYGSHYSAPALVLFFLVRICPNYMLCLQNGRFDHPDRMFNSVPDVFRNCLNNMADFKELIPEFYNTESKGEFLTNKYGIKFGHRHDGTKVNDVTLPPWAKTPKDFVRIMRDALESEYVSRNIHHWIDLIFGYKQNGTEAIKADNLFFHLCYEGSVDLDKIMEMTERHALEVQIMEFGQIPKQLFTSPHVRKMITRIERPLGESGTSSTGSGEFQKTLISLSERLSLHGHRDSVNCVVVSENQQNVISVGKDSLLKIYTLAEGRQLRSVSLGSAPVSSCIQMSENIIITGTWGDEIIIYDLEYGRMSENYRAHDDSVSCMAWSPKENILVSGGWDCMARIWSSIDEVAKGTMRPLRGLKAEFDHDSKVMSIAINKAATSMVTGTDDGIVDLWSVHTKAQPIRLTSHKSTVTGLCFISEDKRLVTCSTDGEFTVIDLGVNSEIYRKKLTEGLKSIACDENLLLLGGVKGTLFFWDLQSVAPMFEIKAHKDTINSIAIGKDKAVFVTGSQDHHIKIWDPVHEKKT